jgi:hypothetical protein
VNELVKRLSEKQAVAAERAGDCQALKEQIEREFVLIKFTETKGGTELGYRIDRQASNIQGVDFEKGRGKVHLEGELVLNYVTVRCIADIDLSTLKGIGYLIPR